MLFPTVKPILHPSGTAWGYCAYILHGVVAAEDCEQVLDVTQMHGLVQRHSNAAVLEGPQVYLFLCCSTHHLLLLKLGPDLQSIEEEGVEDLVPTPAKTCKVKS